MSEERFERLVQPMLDRAVLGMQKVLVRDFFEQKSGVTAPGARGNDPMDVSNSPEVRGKRSNKPSMSSKSGVDSSSKLRVALTEVIPTDVKPMGFWHSVEHLKDFIDFGVNLKTQNEWDDAVSDQIRKEPDQDNWWHRFPGWPQSVDFEDVGAFLHGSKSARVVEKKLRAVIPNLPMFPKAMGRGGFPNSYPNSSSENIQDFPHISPLGSHIVRKVFPEVMRHLFVLQSAIEFSRISCLTSMKVNVEEEDGGVKVLALAQKNMDALLATCSQYAQSVNAFVAAVQEDLVQMTFAGTPLAFTRFSADVNTLPEGDLSGQIQAHSNKCELKRAARNDAPYFRMLPPAPQRSATGTSHYFGPPRGGGGGNRRSGRGRGARGRGAGRGHPSNRGARPDFRRGAGNQRRFPRGRY